MIEKEYLGDGVYVEVENGMFKLTTEDGVRATSTIFLELEIYHAFVRYATRAFEEHQKSPVSKGGG